MPQTLIFGDLEAPFLCTEWPLWWSRGSQEHPTGTLRSRCPFLSIVGSILGVSWDPLWRHFCDFSMIWAAKVGNRCQVHVFDDPGVQMAPESETVRAITTVKTVLFEWFHFFHLFTNVVSWGRVWDVVLESFDDLGGTFFLFLIFEGIGSRLEIYDFSGIPCEDPGWGKTPMGR